MGVSSPTGNGEKRGMEWAGQPGTPLPLRPERAKANNAASVGTHDMDSEMAASGSIHMKDDGKFTKLPASGWMQGITNDKSGTGATDMKAKAIR
jgi:hypothetical protein